MIKVEFCSEFQTSFIQAHGMSPYTFFFNQLLFDVLLKNMFIGDRIDIHRGIFETRHMVRTYEQNNLFMRLRLFSVL